MKMNEESEKPCWELNIQKTKTRASGPITTWQIEGESMESVTDLILLGSKITVNGDCSHKINRHLLLGGKTMTNLDLVLKRRDISLLIKRSPQSQTSVVYPVVMYQFSSISQSCSTLCNPMNPARHASLSVTNSKSSPKPMSIELVMPSNHLILWCPLLLLPSIFPSIRVFSMSQLFTSGGQSIGVSGSTSALPMNI